jgi:hypothetical protein
LIIKLAIAACRGIEKYVNKATFNFNFQLHGLLMMKREGVKI